MSFNAIALLVVILITILLLVKERPLVVGMATVRIRKRTRK